MNSTETKYRKCKCCAGVRPSSAYRHPSHMTCSNCITRKISRTTAFYNFTTLEKERKRKRAMMLDRWKTSPRLLAIKAKSEAKKAAKKYAAKMRRDAKRADILVVETPTHKTCIKCNVSKRICIDNFGPREQNRSGFYGKCKVCENTYQRERRNSKKKCTVVFPVGATNNEKEAIIANYALNRGLVFSTDDDWDKFVTMALLGR